MHRAPVATAPKELDEFLGVTVERPGLDQLHVGVGRTLEDRLQPGVAGDNREQRHLQAVDEAGDLWRASATVPTHPPLACQDSAKATQRMRAEW